MKYRAVAVILAAGEGTRIGGSKALLPYRTGETFLARLSRVFEAAGCLPLAVIGSDARAVAEAHPGIRLAVNTHWPRGQFSSVRAGLRAAVKLRPRWILVHPVDVPMVRAATVRRILNFEGEDRARVPVYHGVLGHPLLLSSGSARRVLQLRVPHLEAALSMLQPKLVRVTDPGVQININTREDYARYLRRPLQAGS